MLPTLSIVAVTIKTPPLSTIGVKRFSSLTEAGPRDTTSKNLRDPLGENRKISAQQFYGASVNITS
jgi:hypothetical protein